MAGIKYEKLQTIHSILNDFGFEMPESEIDAILERVTDNKIKILEHHEVSTSV